MGLFPTHFDDEFVKHIKNVNITAAWAVDREFVHIGFWGDFGLPLVPFGVLWVLFDWPLDSRWPSWDTFGIHLERLGPQGVHVGVPLGGRPDLGTSRALK